MDDLKISKSSLVLAALGSASAHANPIGFDSDRPGALPTGWTAGVTGRGAPKWAVEADSTAPSAPTKRIQVAPAVVANSGLQGDREPRIGLTWTIR